MTRRNALDRLRNQAQDPISSIPLAQERKRSNRSWDHVHRGITYFVPIFLNEPAKEMRASILALAQKHMTNTSTVAAALMSFSLTHVQRGKLAIEARPHASRRKMALTWEEADGPPQKIPGPLQRNGKEKAKNVYLNYRWDRELDAQVKALAGEELSPGEIVVFLLNYALAAHESGHLMLKEEPRILSQKVTPTW
jgi:hypothetical protein